MPSTRNYRELHERVTAREGAAERLAALRDETLKEIGLDELRRAVDRSQADIAAELSISQSAVSQIERSGDIGMFNTMHAENCVFSATDKKGSNY